MNQWRTEILRATAMAANVLARFPSEPCTGFDVVGATAALGFPILFRPMSGLLGATVVIEDDVKGILVTTNRELSIQRFTLAHELGHCLLGHGMSMDNNIGFAGRFQTGPRPAVEVAADVFASELLAPLRRIASSAKRHGWNKTSLKNPKHIYQLSLRLGISFKATCWALASHNLISEDVARNSQDQEVKPLKHELVSHEHIKHGWVNVWDISAGDSGTHLEGAPDDLFVLRLEENASAGFLWDIADADATCRVLESKTDVVGHLGTPSVRRMTLRFQEPGTHRLYFRHHRPWKSESIAHIDVTINNYGKETEGLPRLVRESAVVSLQS